MTLLLLSLCGAFVATVLLKHYIRAFADWSFGRLLALTTAIAFFGALWSIFGWAAFRH